MADYRVTYSKHKQFKEGKGERGSIVRIFTNINLRYTLLGSYRCKDLIETFSVSWCCHQARVTTTALLASVGSPPPILIVRSARLALAR